MSSTAEDAGKLRRSGRPGDAVQRASVGCTKGGGTRQATTKTCAFDGVRRSRSLAVRTTGARCFCGTHNQEGHYQPQGKRCEADNCKTRAIFGSSDGGSKKSFCAAHRQEGNVNVQDKRWRPTAATLWAAKPRTWCVSAARIKAAAAAFTWRACDAWRPAARARARTGPLPAAWPAVALFTTVHVHEPEGAAPARDGAGAAPTGGCGGS